MSMRLLARAVFFGYAIFRQSIVLAKHLSKLYIKHSAERRIAYIRFGRSVIRDFTYHMRSLVR